MGLCVCDCGGVWKIDTLHCHSLYALALLFVNLHIDLHVLSLDIMSSRSSSDCCCLLFSLLLFFIALLSLHARQTASQVQLCTGVLL